MIKLLRFIKGRSLALSLLAIFFTFVSAGLDIVQPLFLMNTVNAVQDIQNNVPDGWPKFWANVEYMALFAFGSLFFSLLGTFAASYGSLLIAKTIRQAMFDKVQSFSFNEIEKVGTGSLINRITNDVQKYQLNMQMIFSMLLKAPIMIIGGLIMAFSFDPTLGSIVLAILVVMTAVIILIAWKTIPIFEEAQSKLDSINTILRETALGMRVIKSLRIQNELHHRFDHNNKQLRKKYIKGGSLMIPIMTTISLAMQVGIVIILMVGGFEIGGENPEMASKMFGFSQILMIVLGATVLAIVVIVNSTRAMASIHRINEVFAMKNTITNIANPLSEMADNSVHFKNVNFKFEKKSQKNILTNISFEVKQGETLGIIGGTGSGKSTIANLIPRLYDVISGEILIGNKNVRDYDIDFLRDQIGMVTQNAFLFSGTIKENLLFGKRNATEKEMIETSKNACSWDFIGSKEDKFNSKVEQRGRNFSGGQKQRISLARTLIKNPKILILDDTTSALDLITEGKVQQNLSNNFKESTKIIVSQRISSIKNADKILVLDRGKIVGLGKHKELLKNNKLYRSIHNSQVGARYAEEN